MEKAYLKSTKLEPFVWPGHKMIVSKTIHGVLTELYSKQQKKMVCDALSRKVVKEVCIGCPQRIQPTKVPTHKMIVEAY